MKPLLHALAHWKRPVLLGLGLTSVTVISATIGALLALSSATTPLLKRDLTPAEVAVFAPGGSFTHRPLPLPELSRPVNILIMGMSVLTSDVQNSPRSSRNLGYLAQVNSFDGLADVLILLRFDPKTNQLTLLSIPRDTRIVTQRAGVIKINATNVLGGPATTAKTVSQLLSDLPIDRYIRVNVGGVQKLVDVLGGVTVNVPKDMKYKDDAQHLYINLKAGRQHLNGSQTLQLLRFRHDAQGDIGRIERQQLVMRSLIEQKLNPLTLLKLPQVFHVISSHLDSNLNGDELVALGLFTVKTDLKSIHTLTLPGEANGRGRSGISYWIPDESRIQQLLIDYFADGVQKIEARG